MILNKIDSYEINQALKRHLNKKIFEERILEHPDKALDRTSFKNRNGTHKLQSKSK